MSFANSLKNDPTSKDRFFGQVTCSVIPKWASFEIDEFEDVDLCEYFMMKNVNK